MRFKLDLHVYLQMLSTQQTLLDTRTHTKLNLKCHTNWAWWYMSAILAFWLWRQEDNEFGARLNCSAKLLFKNDEDDDDDELIKIER